MIFQIISGRDLNRICQGVKDRGEVKRVTIGSVLDSAPGCPMAGYAASLGGLEEYAPPLLPVAG